MNRYGEVFSTNIAEGDSETFTHANPTILLSPWRISGELTDNSGSFSYTCADHTEALVTRQGVFLRLYDLQYCAVLEYLQRSPQLAIITLLAGILVLCVGMFISFRTSAKLSAPIEVLYSNYVKKPSNDHAGDDELGPAQQGLFRYVHESR